jgi:Phycobilisome protein
MSQAQLSEKARELIKKARIVSFSGWQDSHSSEVIECFQKADDQGLYLTDQDLQLIWQSTNSDLVLVVKQLRDRSGEIVDKARSQVLQSFPNITQIGGGLYPPVRAEACWRDFWHFLRCITYGIAGARTDYTSAKGLEYMQLLYTELDVPLEAMITGLESIKATCLSQVKTEQSQLLAPYFDHLINALKQFH